MVTNDILHSLKLVWENDSVNTLIQRLKAGLILGLGPANERWRYLVMTSPIGWHKPRISHVKELRGQVLVEMKRQVRKIYFPSVIFRNISLWLYRVLCTNVQGNCFPIALCVEHYNKMCYRPKKNTSLTTFLVFNPLAGSNCQSRFNTRFVR